MSDTLCERWREAVTPLLGAVAWLEVEPWRAGSVYVQWKDAPDWEAHCGFVGVGEPTEEELARFVRSISGEGYPLAKEEL